MKNSKVIIAAILLFGGIVTVNNAVAGVPQRLWTCTGGDVVVALTYDSRADSVVATLEKGGAVRDLYVQEGPRSLAYSSNPENQTATLSFQFLKFTAAGQKATATVSARYYSGSAVGELVTISSQKLNCEAGR